MDFVAFIIFWIILIGSIPGAVYTLGSRRAGERFREHAAESMRVYNLVLGTAIAAGSTGGFLLYVGGNRTLDVIGILFLVASCISLTMLSMIAIAISVEMIGDMRIDRRAMLNQCLQCGYTLTGNTSGRCPECGTRVAIEKA